MHFWYVCELSYVLNNSFRSMQLLSVSNCYFYALITKPDSSRSKRWALWSFDYILGLYFCMLLMSAPDHLLPALFSILRVHETCQLRCYERGLFLMNYIYKMRNQVMVSCRQLLQCNFWLHIQLTQRYGFNVISWLTLFGVVRMFSLLGFALMVIPFYFMYKKRTALVGISV